MKTILLVASILWLVLGFIWEHIGEQTNCLICIAIATIYLVGVLIMCELRDKTN